MEQMIIAIALWCAVPTSPNSFTFPLNERPSSVVQECRDRLWECLNMSGIIPSRGSSKMLECFKKEKLK